MTPQEQTPKKKRRTVHSISFKDDDFKIIQLAAQQEGISFASFLKYATLEYIKESLEYQRLVKSGAMSQEQKEKTVPEAMGVFEDTIKKTLLSIHENIKFQLRVIRWYAERGLYYQFYYSQMTVPEERDERAKLAKIRMDSVTDELVKLLDSDDKKKIEPKNDGSGQENKQ